MPKQIYSSVFWTQTIQNMVKAGIKIFVEVGPGRVLNGLIKKTEPDVVVYSINNIETFNEAIELIKEYL